MHWTRTICCLSLLVIFGEASLMGQAYIGVKGSYSIPFNRPEEIKYDNAADEFIYRVNFIEQDFTPTISIVGYFREELVYFQTELAYRRTKTKFKSDNYIDLTNIISRTNVKTTHSVDLPLIAGLRLGRFKLGVGPMFSFIVAQNKIFQDTDLFEERRKNVEVGFGFQTGIVLYRLHLDITYQYRFNGVGDYLYWRSEYKGFSTPVQFLDVGLGFFF